MGEGVRNMRCLLRGFWGVVLGVFLVASASGQVSPRPANPAATATRPAAAAPAQQQLQQASADQARFDDVLAEAVRFMRTGPNFKLDVTTDWKTARGAEGKNHF